MNKGEISLRLIELYYNNIEIFRARCMSLNDLCKKYKEVLNKLKELEEGKNE